MSGLRGAVSVAERPMFWYSVVRIYHSHHRPTNTNSPKICYNSTEARKDNRMKVNYQERIEDTEADLKIIMLQQRTVTRQTKSSGTLFVKIRFEPEHYRCS